MRKLAFLLLIFTLEIFVSKAQDIIVLQTKEQIQVKLIEVTDSEVVYKMFDKPDGPVYRLKSSAVKEIKFLSQEEKNATSGYRKSANTQQQAAENLIESDRPKMPVYMFGAIGFPIAEGVVKDAFVDQMKSNYSAFNFSLGGGVDIFEGLGLLFVFNKNNYNGSFNNVDFFLDDVFWGIGPQFSLSLGQNSRFNLYTLYGRTGIQIGGKPSATRNSLQQNNSTPVTVSLDNLSTIMIGANMRLPANTPLAFIPSFSWQNTFSTGEHLSTFVISAGIGINVGVK